MRKKFLVKPRLQLSHLAWTVATVAVSCVIAYFVFESMVSSAFLHGGLPSQNWMLLRPHLRTGFFVMLVILLGAIGIESYLLFHRFIGPLYALEKGLKKLSEGDWNYVTKIREYDQLSDLIKVFAEMKEEMKARFETQEKAAQMLAKELDRVLRETSKANVIELRDRLVEIRNQMRKEAA